MVDTRKLRGKIVENGFTNAQVAKEIGVSEATFSRKMRSGKFGLDDAERLMELLNIEDPCSIFFARK